MQHTKPVHASQHSEQSLTWRQFQEQAGIGSRRHGLALGIRRLAASQLKGLAGGIGRGQGVDDESSGVGAQHTAADGVALVGFQQAGRLIALVIEACKGCIIVAGSQPFLQ